MAICILRGHGNCRGHMSREHYISKSVLTEIAKNTVLQIGGLPWQEPNVLQNIGINSLTAKIFCEGHNSELGQLDQVALRFFNCINAIDKNPETLPASSVFLGKQLERWMLKILIGLASSTTINNRAVPMAWKDLLMGGTWPPKWGLYFPNIVHETIFIKNLEITTHINPENKNVLASTFNINGILATLCLGVPDDPEKFGIFRPRGLIFPNTRDGEKRIELRWPRNNVDAIIYTKVGISADPPPQWKEWVCKP